MNVVWSEQAKESLQNIYFYSYSKSPQNAASVLDALLALGESLADQKKEFSLNPIINKQRLMCLNFCLLIIGSNENSFFWSANDSPRASSASKTEADR